MHGEKSAASRITENDSSFSNIPESSKQVTGKTAVAQRIIKDRLQFTNKINNFQYPCSSKGLLARAADKAPKIDSKDVRTAKAIPVDEHTRCSVIRSRSICILPKGKRHMQ
ncbi:hypothetical protein AVEN_132489-1 [Araneus ventricosus]|uniref:Uncharacterized protein n=1 Tax=Araneus ventricosus TaxID=182803 RepID=A0A4Y2G2F8_ARAVE|nr:hypothetical protein AVEN_132489-1 [Araneus ventricosus]